MTSDERWAIYYRDHGICQACGRPVLACEFQLAHRIANTVAFRRKYGSEIIDHPLNVCVTHPGRCNDRMNIGNNPGACQALLQQIEEHNHGSDQE